MQKYYPSLRTFNMTLDLKRHYLADQLHKPSTMGVRLQPYKITSSTAHPGSLSPVFSYFVFFILFFTMTVILPTPKLVPTLIDDIARDEPQRVWCEIPEDGKDLSKGFRKITFK